MDDNYTPEHRAGDEEPLIGDAPPKDRVLLSNKAYDLVKRSSLYVLPALAAAYFSLAQIWGLPKAEEVLGTVAVLETLIGVVLRVSRSQYEHSDARFDGQITVEPDDVEAQTTAVRVLLDPSAILDKDELTVKVERR